MKNNIFTFGLLLAIAFGFAACKKGPKTDYDRSNFSTFEYYSYKANKVIENIGDPIASQNNAGWPMAIEGDRIYLATKNDEGKPSILIFNKNSGKVDSRITTWLNDGAETNFNTIYSICVGKKFFYVGEQFIHVFDKASMLYVTSIGNGQWTGQIFQPSAMYEWQNEYLLAKEKQDRISIYRISDMTLENSKKINRAYHTDAVGDATNTFFGEVMHPNAESDKIWFSESANFIAQLDPALIANLDGTKGGSILVEESKIPTEFVPHDFIFVGKHLYATGNNGAISIYNTETNTWEKTDMKNIAGYSFANPKRLLPDGENSMWVADVSKKTLVQVSIRRNEILEFSKISDKFIQGIDAVTGKHIILDLTDPGILAL